LGLWGSELADTIDEAEQRSLFGVNTKGISNDTPLLPFLTPHYQELLEICLGPQAGKVHQYSQE
jgi:hypothetical protein